MFRTATVPALPRQADARQTDTTPRRSRQIDRVCPASLRVSPATKLGFRLIGTAFGLAGVVDSRTPVTRKRPDHQTHNSRHFAKRRTQLQHSLRYRSPQPLSGSYDIRRTPALAEAYHPCLTHLTAAPLLAAS